MNSTNQSFMKSIQSIPVYTVLKILQKIRHQLGLEAMLDYTNYYLKIVETHNPDVKKAVEDALSHISVEKIYKEARGCQEDSSG